MQRKEKKEVYYSKVMLFGEYSIILGSMGLTIPYSHFNGELRFINKNSYTDLNFANQSNRQLKELKDYIIGLKESGKLICQFDTERLNNDLKKGLFFESTIPEGYGLGSSGALVAALYSEYAHNAIVPRAGMPSKDIFELKNTFAQIESFYHGTSSGIDPLICYLKHPIVMENAQKVLSVGIPRRDILENDAIFLVNSGKPGKTGPLVKLFMEKIKNESFLNKIINHLIPLNNLCIQTLLSGNISEMYDHLKELSEFQLDHFPEMIPESIREIWQQGLKNNNFIMKLCGSGGGGFMLGFTRNFKDAKQYFQQKNMELIPVYQDIIN